MSTFDSFCSQISFTNQQKESLALLAAPASYLSNQQESKEFHDDQIDNTQQFLALFSKIEEQMISRQEDDYRQHLSYASLLTESTQDILDKAEGLESILKKLKECYEFVILKTQGLKSDCQEMLNSQTQLNMTADSILSKLQYFSEFEAISLLLLTPGDEFILDTRFVDSLQKLDNCLQFCSENSSFKDAALYKMRYRQCMTRCMTLIKMNIVDSIRKITLETRDKIDQKISSNSETTVFSSLFIAKFRSISSQVKDQIKEIEIRCEGHKEYNQLLSDCYNCYFSCRKSLLVPVINKYLESLDVTQGLVSLVFIPM